MNILTVKDIVEIYGMNKKYVYQLIGTEGCPVLPRETGGKIRVIQSEFEKWIYGYKQ